jgi:hypothetical protein
MALDFLPSVYSEVPVPAGIHIYLFTTSSKTFKNYAIQIYT